MASIEKRGGKYLVIFRYEGKKYGRSVGTDKLQKAQIVKAQIERNMELVSIGVLEVPAGCDVFDFFLTGKALDFAQKIEKEEIVKKHENSKISIERLFNMYFDAFLKESIEENSFGMLETHRNNLERLIGKRTKAATFGTGDIQKYVDKRAKEPGRRGKIQATKRAGLCRREGRLQAIWPDENWLGAKGNFSIDHREVFFAYKADRRRCCGRKHHRCRSQK